MIEECSYKLIAKSQRETEVKAGLGLEGTFGFESRGCYECDGKNKDCESYVDLLDRRTRE